MKKQKQIAIVIPMDPDLKRRLKQAAKEDGNRSLASLARQIIERHVADELKRPQPAA